MSSATAARTIGWKNKEADFLGDISENVTDCYIRTAADESAVKAAFGDVKTEKVGNALVFFTGKRTEKEINEKHCGARRRLFKAACACLTDSYSICIFEIIITFFPDFVRRKDGFIIKKRETNQ